MIVVKYTLSSPSIYYMSLFVIPRKVSLTLEKLQRDLLWEGGEFQSRPHLVTWSIVGLDKKDGGLDIRKLSTLNKALLGIWCCRFASKSKSLWKHVIVGKYGVEQREWCSKASKEGYNVDPLKAIQSGW